jgi:molecular chaperone DnaK
MIDAADVYVHEDDLRREVVELRNRASGLLYTSDRSLREYGEHLKPAEREAIVRDMQQCREMLESDDPDVLEQVLEQLEMSAHRIAETMYSEMAYTGEDE